MVVLAVGLPYLWPRKSGAPWLLLPAAGALGLFEWLLTLHPSGAGRTYATYGGVHVVAAVLWMWLIEKRTPDRWDLVGCAIALVGMSVIAFGPRKT